MEKLIELLNEYEKTLEPNLQIEWTEVWIKSTPEIVISKKFWFIKWLVENDKIDWLKFYGENEYTPIWVNAKSDIDQVYSVEEQILMALSISDTPIEDLISYLHE